MREPCLPLSMKNCRRYEVKLLNINWVRFYCQVLLTLWDKKQESHLTISNRIAEVLVLVVDSREIIELVLGSNPGVQAGKVTVPPRKLILVFFQGNRGCLNFLARLNFG